jgi:hypothetical protein
MFHWIDAWAIALTFAVAMFASWYLGWRLGRRLHPEPGEDPGTKFTDASMALLGLLLAFTFSMAMVRHDQRRLAVVAESNAIGDFNTCVTLLREPKRSDLQIVIRDYAHLQLDMLRRLLPATEEENSLQRSREMQAQMTSKVAQAIDGRPMDLALTNTLNNLTSAHASRLAAYDEIVPWSIVLLLLLSSIVPSFLIGMKQGETHKLHHSGTLSFIVLVSLVIFVTLDLNQPRRGLIRVNREPLERLTKSLDM